MKPSALPIVAVWAFLATLTGAQHARADAEAAGKALEGKGLKAYGTLYLLPAEAELAKLVADMRKAQAELRKATAASNAVEKKLDQVKNHIAGKEFEMRKLFEELGKGNLTVDRNNQIVGKINSIELEIKTIREGPLAKVQREFNDANDVFVKVRQDYIDKTLAANALSDTAASRYDELGKDAEVTAALSAITAATERKAVLGPGASYKANAAFVGAARKGIDNESIPVIVENNVSTVEVMLNGKVRRSMVVDTGAGLVCVPADLAAALELAPTEDTPKIQLQLADGKIVEAWLMTLASVQVGPFTVEGVECAVLPDTLVAAQPLLGGSFLKNFVVKLDPERAKLELSRVKGSQ